MQQLRNAMRPQPSHISATIKAVGEKTSLSREALPPPTIPRPLFTLPEVNQQMLRLCVCFDFLYYPFMVECLDTYRMMNLTYAMIFICDSAIYSILYVTTLFNKYFILQFCSYINIYYL